MEPTLPTLAPEQIPPEAGEPQPTSRPAWRQGLIVAGAFLSALAVLYATDVVPALGSAAVFFLFYRRLRPAHLVMAREPAPRGSDAREERRDAA